MDRVELQEIVVSVLAISFAFTVMRMGTGITGVGSAEFVILFPITLLTVGLGFVLHELAHRYVARSYGAYAIYKAWPTGLLFMLALAVMNTGFLFAAPGAVYIYSQYISRKQNGIISVAGPLTNVALGLVFAFLVFLIPYSDDAVIQLARMAFAVGFQVNIFLALFNLIPIFPLDGSKVFAWDKGIWGSVVIGCLVLMFLAPVAMNF